MKRSIFTILIISLLSLTACNKKEDNTNKTLQAMPAGTHSAKVLDRIDAANYSYFEVSEDGNDYWIAAPQKNIEKGTTIYFNKSMEMKDFYSKSLDRKFDKILFVQDVSTTAPSSSTADQKETLSSVHGQVNTVAKEDVSVKPVAGGKTIAEVYKNKDGLAGKVIKIKGKVTKFNANIMGRNWIHIQDGTSINNSDYDLLITSKDNAQVGETVIAEGTVETNKDFGAGYSYSVLVENAKVNASK